MDRVSTTLGEYERDVIRFFCSACGRKEEYLKETLLAEHGPKISMSKLLPLMTKCVRADCRVRYYFQYSKGS